MKMKRIDVDFTVCKVKDATNIDLTQEYCFVGKTDEELSLVCATESVPQETIERDDGWKALRIEGVLDFSLIGILSKISTLLAENEIGIFAISTFNTDYILVKKEDYDKTIEVLAGAGYEIARQSIGENGIPLVVTENKANNYGQLSKYAAENLFAEEEENAYGRAMVEKHE